MNFYFIDYREKRNKIAIRVKGKSINYAQRTDTGRNFRWKIIYQQ